VPGGLRRSRGVAGPVIDLAGVLELCQTSATESGHSHCSSPAHPCSPFEPDLTTALCPLRMDPRKGGWRGGGSSVWRASLRGILAPVSPCPLGYSRINLASGPSLPYTCTPAAAGPKCSEDKAPFSMALDTQDFPGPFPLLPSHQPTHKCPKPAL
jgi:hypothetical protein